MLKPGFNSNQPKFQWIDPPLERFQITSEDTEAGRIYTGPNGTKYWSMTTMLKRTSKNKGWLEEWKKSIGEEAAREITSDACTRGESIHDAAEMFVKNINFQECCERAGKYLRFFKQLSWALQTNVTKIYATELPIFSNIMKVGGRLDLLAEWRGELALIDYKGANSFKTLGNTLDYKHQLCGYSLAVEELYGVKPRKLINIVANSKSPTPTILITDRNDVLREFADRIREFHLTLAK